MDLSIIVTAHNEGFLLRKCIKSVFAALRKVDQVNYEIIIHLDNPSEETRSCASDFSSNRYITIYENRFEDAGRSRNYAIERSGGKYIQLVDGDDLICSNHLRECFKAVKDDSKSLYCSKYVLYFGDEYKMKEQYSATGQLECARILFSENEWHAAVFGCREIFEKTPYRPSENGFGHEDWTFNIDASANGFGHKVLEKSVYFYRKRRGSLCAKNDKTDAMQPASPLFEKKFFKDVTFGEAIPEEESDRKYHKLPFFLRVAIVRTGLIEAGVLPLSNRRKSFYKYRTINYVFVSKLYCQMLEDIVQKPKAVVFSAKEKRSKNHLVLSDEQLDEKYEIKFPALNEREHDILISRIVAESGAKEIIYADSKYGKEWLKKHAVYINNEFCVYVTSGTKKHNLVQECGLDDKIVIVANP